MFKAFLRHFAVWIWYKVAHKKLTVEITFVVNVLYFLCMVQYISQPPYKVFPLRGTTYFSAAAIESISLLPPPYKMLFTRPDYTNNSLSVRKHIGKEIKHSICRTFL